ncbi:MAG: hypothetical protein BAJATHORv1_10275 [Candidatus Thorarchaeota archaeon]|nr:MAG: hypothetical protein BAJATHORv1_10275 [Candidatus Thorarchaeota archaeon]
MRAGSNTRKFASIILIVALFAPYLFGGFAPIHANAQEEQTIVFDMSHGQYSDSIWEAEDFDLRLYLGPDYKLVWAWGGLNDSVLADADGLVIGSIYGDENGFTTAEIEAVSTWFNAGNKFLWVGADSDFSGAYINNNMSAILEACGSHVYPEPTAVEDPEYNAGSAYRVVATEYSTDPFVADIVEGVNATLMHGPTCLYGATGGAADAGPVDLRTTDIANVYPVMRYSENAVIADGDTVDPLAHPTDAEGDFVAMTVETYAGTNQTGIIVVSGASPYGDYKPMTATSYYDVPLTGHYLVRQTFDWGMEMAPTLVAPDPLGGLLPIIAVVGIAIVVVVVMYFIMKK